MERNPNKRTQNLQDEGSRSSQKILKSKYIHNDSNRQTRQKITSSTQKIMLTDLCPEEKAKVGELIKTLESRKQENQTLEAKLRVLKTNIFQLQKQKQQNQTQLKLRELETQKVSIELREEQKKCIQKDIQIEQLIADVLKLRKPTAVRTGVYTATDDLIRVEEASVQTRDKKRKTKERQVQVGSGRIDRTLMDSDLRHQKNSQSYDRIMNGQRNHHLTQNGQKRSKIQRRPELMDQSVENNYTAIFGGDHLHQNQNVESMHDQNTFRGLNKALNEDWDQNIEGLSYVHTKQNPSHRKTVQEADLWNLKEDRRGAIQVQDTENDDDQFEMLAKKWLQLKNHNRNSGPSNQPRYNMSQSQSQNGQEQSVEIERSQEGTEQIDEEQLNRALKSRDFSASNVLNNSRSRRNPSENSQRKAKGRNASKSPVQVRREKEKILESRNKVSNFYSPELLDLVAEINQ